MERVIACPYCGDKPGRHHKHCYVNVEAGVFFCHLCGAKGSIKKLEKDFPGLLRNMEIVIQAKKATAKQVSELDFKPLLSVDNNYAKVVVEYLKSRGLTLAEISKVFWSPQMPGRAIFVCWEGNEIVFWTARSAVENKLRYILPKKGTTKLTRKEAVFGLEKFSPPVNKLWITEGVFDALAVKGVALFGKYASDIQLKKILSLHPQKVIIALDRDAEKDAQEIYKKLSVVVPCEIRTAPPEYADWADMRAKGVVIDTD